MDEGGGTSTSEHDFTLEKGSSTGFVAPIAGGTVGGIFVIIIIILTVVFLLRRQVKKKQEADPAQADMQPMDTIDGIDNRIMDDLQAWPPEKNEKTSSRPSNPTDKPGGKPPKPNTKPVAIVPPVTSADGTIYENVAVPGPILMTEIITYQDGIGQKDKAANEYKLVNKEQRYPWEIASKEEFKKKNRFKNIIPYDHSRVVLEKVSGDPLSDYYNASYIKDYKGNRCFIASQAPNKASIGDFLRMIWQKNISTIVMVTNFVEDRKDKCKPYWPKHVDSTEKFGDFTVYLTDEIFFSDHVVRRIVVKRNDSSNAYKFDDGSMRTITHFHYVSWPDMGVPKLCTSLIEFTESVKEHHVKNLKNGHTEPLLVHCSAGVGRTGTFLTLYNMFDMMRETGKVDVFGYVDRMREDRISMVQTPVQYEFIYKVLYEAYVTGDTTIPVSRFPDKCKELLTTSPRETKSLLQLEYQNLEILTPEPSPASCCGGRSPENASKNRFPNIIPMDSKRPHLMSRGDSTSNSYINASFVDTFRKKDAFLVTQSPLPNTVLDIWRMILDWKCPVIVMLNQLDPDDQTCVQYWPDGESLRVGDATVSLSQEEKLQTFTRRTFTISGTGQCLNVEHFQFHAWRASQMGPDLPAALLNLLEAVDYSAKKSEGQGPIVVHCLNGISRTGVFCTLWSVLQKIKQSEKVDIFQAVKRLRAGRPNMVDSLELYQLCYDVIYHQLQGSVEYANLDAFR